MTENRCFSTFGLSEKLADRDGGALMRTRGCNGTHHVDHLYVEYRDTAGKLLRCSTQSFLELDVCDGSCTKTRLAQGFLYDPRVTPYSLPC